MTDDETLSDRIDALEARLMFQDATIETLNQTVTSQWREIAALKRRISELIDRLREVEANGAGPGNDRPPHY